MAVFALNYAHAASESTFSVEPVRLSDAGVQVGVGEDLPLSAQGDVDDFVHCLALGCFPNAPVTRCITEKSRVSPHLLTRSFTQFGQHLVRRRSGLRVGRLSGLSDRRSPVEASAVLFIGLLTSHRWSRE